jgi:hypothetical protein
MWLPNVFVAVLAAVMIGGVQVGFVMGMPASSRLPHFSSATQAASCSAAASSAAVPLFYLSDFAVLHSAAPPASRPDPHRRSQP